MQSITLANNIKIPILGLGTWSLSGHKAISTVKKALKIGYTHFGTAESYENEIEMKKSFKSIHRQFFYEIIQFL